MGGGKATLQQMLRDYVTYLKEEGVQEVPKGRVARKAQVAAPAPTPAPATMPAPTTAPKPRVAQAPGPVAPPQPSPQVVRTEVSATAAPGETLESIAAEVRACHACELCQGRHHAVPGEGNGNQPDIMFVGEGPGADEDAQGRPFVGRSGQLLNKMIKAMGYEREQVFIGNIVKCRPPGNRTPYPGEMAWCMPYLLRQITLVRPKCIVCLGKTAMVGLLGITGPMSEGRGRWHQFQGIPVAVTYHPAYLLRDPRQKAACWHDLQAVMAFLRQGPGA